MENKNTQANKSSSLERNELHNTIWKVANELRGSVDGWDFKQYVLGILFYRYISENMTHYINKKERKSDPSFDYALLSDEEAEDARKSLIEEKGFYIPPSALFCNVLKNAADLAFTMHMLSYLSNSGTAAIVEFPGVLYRGNAEAKIREYLVKENFIDCVIALPDNLFFGTSIATCILVLKKNKQDDTTLFIDASKEFVKEGKKNKLKEHNREKILKTYTERKIIKHFSALASIEQIKENDYNLSVNRYVEQEDTKEIIDIKALNAEISQIVEKQSALRNSLDLIIKELEEGQNA
ncbi:hypothetical protein HpBT151_08910 [Helicobacter pylori]